MASGIAADEIDGIESAIRQCGGCSDASVELNRALLADGLARFEQKSGNVLRNYPLFVLPAFDVRARDIGLQILAMMMFCVPRARRLVKAAQPQHSIGNE